MRNVLFVLLLLFSGMSLFARNCIDEEHLVNIEVSKNKKENVTPRDIFIPPLECHLYNRAIFLSLFEDLGDLTIVISGANSRIVVNAESTDEMVEIDINDCENGYYTIEIITENQDTYTGEFILQ